MNGSLAYGKGNSVPDSENSMCKGPEVGGGLVYFRNRKKARKE